MNNNISPFTDIYNFKKVIDDIIDANLINKGIVKYIAAKVVSVNSNGTVNVYIPPDNSNIVNGLANKTGESLLPGDSVELCAKNGSIKNSWIAVKHGISQSGSSDNFPIGSIVGFAGTSVPNNWLIADGSEVSRETYSELFEVIGTYYGEGDGATTFNLPDMRGKVGVGLLATDEDFNILGNIGGSKTHIQTIDEMPNHSHTIKYNTNGAGSNAGGTVALAASISTSTFPSGEVGGGQAMDIMNPYVVINYIVKVSQGTSFVPSTAATVINNLTNTSITDALSANMGRQLNENLESLKPVKLWENPIRGTFTAQTVSVPNLSEYSYIEIFFWNWTAGQYGIQSTRCPVADGNVLHLSYTIMLYDGTTPSTPHFGGRLGTISTTNNTIAFGNNFGCLCYSNPTTNTDNAWGVPMMILGYKY